MMLTVLAGLASMGAIATVHTENEGHLSPRTIDYAQDKMEQLPALAYTDSSEQDRVVFPATTSGGTGLAVGGSTTAPVIGYVDWLESTGACSAAERPRRQAGSTSGCGRSACRRPG